MLEDNENDAKKFSDLNKINYISISSKDDNEIKNILNNLLVNLENNNNKILLNHESKKEYKIIFIGDSCTGAKTSLINRIIGIGFAEDNLSTIGMGIETTKLVLKNGKEINLKLYDTAGQERFRAITFKTLSRNNIDFVVLGYDITNKRSFDSLFNWIDNIKECNTNTKLIYIIGNKMDLEGSREVGKEEGKRFAENLNLRFFEVSARTGEGIEAFLNDLKNEIAKYEM